jgi:NADH:ubiquinone oxidoreductase subunit 6 (subunit J)
MILTSAIFTCFASGALGSAILVITSKNPIYCVFFLVINFLSAAGLVFIFGLEFIPMIFIILYVGAIAILFLFVVMMLDIKLVDLNNTKSKFIIITSLFILIFIGHYFLEGFNKAYFMDYSEFLFKNHTIMCLGNTNVTEPLSYDLFRKLIIFTYLNNLYINNDIPAFDTIHKNILEVKHGTLAVNTLLDGLYSKAYESVKITLGDDKINKLSDFCLKIENETDTTVILENKHKIINLLHGNLNKKLNLEDFKSLFVFMDRISAQLNPSKNTFSYEEMVTLLDELSPSASQIENLTENLQNYNKKVSPITTLESICHDTSYKLALDKDGLFVFKKKLPLTATLDSICHDTSYKLAFDKDGLFVFIKKLPITTSEPICHDTSYKLAFDKDGLFTFKKKIPLATSEPICYDTSYKLALDKDGLFVFIKKLPLSFEPICHDNSDKLAFDKDGLFTFIKNEDNIKSILDDMANMMLHAFIKEEHAQYINDFILLDQLQNDISVAIINKILNSYSYEEAGLYCALITSIYEAHFLSPLQLTEYINSLLTTKSELLQGVYLNILFDILINEMENCNSQQECGNLLISVMSKMVDNYKDVNMDNYLIEFYTSILTKKPLPTTSDDYFKWIIYTINNMANDPLNYDSDCKNFMTDKFIPFVNSISNTNNQDYKNITHFLWGNFIIFSSNLQNIGNVLYTNYVFLFIMAGIILLVAMIGAIVLTLYRSTKVKRQEPFNQVSGSYNKSIDIKK